MDKETEEIRKKINYMNPYQAYLEGFSDGQQDIIDAVKSMESTDKTGFSKEGGKDEY